MIYILSLRFCQTRWVEDRPVRALEALGIWPLVVKVVKYWEGLCKSKGPTINSYKVTVDCYADLPVP